MSDSQQLMPMRAAIITEETKNRDYREIIHKSGNIFYPLVMEALGRWGPTMRGFFNGLSNRLLLHCGGITEFHGVSHPSSHRTLNYWKARITLTSIFSSMKGLLYRMNQAVKREASNSLANQLLEFSSNQRAEITSHFQDPEDFSQHNRAFLYHSLHTE
jgi:hypothetical protein